MKKVYVLLVNWNGWEDTIECLETVLRSDYDNFRIIVCDNGSSDNSLEYIRGWAENRFEVSISEKTQLRNLSYPPIPKPVPYIEYDQVEAERGGRDDERNERLILVRTDSNLGFAGGNNVGLRYVLARQDADYVWLLNNDTVVEPAALSSLVWRMQEGPEVGMCGSMLLYYDRPKRIQALGGYYCKWIGMAWHLGCCRSAGTAFSAMKVENRMNYVTGASMLVSTRFLKDVGLMCEDYFLYFEEVDWAMRARGRYSLAYAPESRVFHKVGRSIGTSSNPWNKTFTCDFYNLRNRLYFTRRFFPAALPVVYLVVLGALVVRVLLGKWDRVAMIVKLLTNSDQFQMNSSSTTSSTF